MTPLIILGRGGHALACLDVIHTTKKFNVLGYVDDVNSQLEDWEGIPCLGTDNELEKIINNHTNNFFLGIGQIKDSKVRRKIVTLLKNLKANFPSVLSPHAYISSGAQIGEGTIVMHGTHVGPGTTIGAFNILNTKSLIEHGSITGEFVHVSTAAVVNGDVKIGKDVFVGSNSVLCHGIEVPDSAFIQAGQFIGRKHAWR